MCVCACACVHVHVCMCVCVCRPNLADLVRLGVKTSLEKVCKRLGARPLYAGLSLETHLDCMQVQLLKPPRPFRIMDGDEALCACVRLCAFVCVRACVCVCVDLGTDKHVYTCIQRDIHIRMHLFRPVDHGNIIPSRRCLINILLWPPYHALWIGMRRAVHNGAAIIVPPVPTKTQKFSKVSPQRTPARLWSCHQCIPKFSTADIQRLDWVNVLGH
jgi:hypothetical protein